MISTSKRMGSLEIKNRFVRSATFEGMATTEGLVTDRLVEFYRTLAKGGAGLIMTGYAYVHNNGKAFDKQIGAYDDSLIPGLRKIAEVVHEEMSDCKIALQIAHCGRQSRHLENTLAPSAIMELVTRKMPKKMTLEEIRETIETFAQSIRRAKESGFDAVQLHGAHGYLISEFLSPYTNRRNDEYGGNLEKRIRFLKDIFERSVEMVSSDFPIMIKMNGTDFLEGGLDIDEAKEIAKKLEKIGYAALEISGGMWDVVKRKKSEIGWKPTFIPESRVFVGTINDPAYNLPLAKAIKMVVDIPVITVGGINSLDLSNSILEEGSADFIGFSRPMIREPDLPKRWLEGRGENKVECVYCNNCLATVMTGIECVKKKEEK